MELILNKFKSQGWKISHKLSIKGCPTYFLFKDHDKVVFILANMENKTYILYNLYYHKPIKKEQKLETKQIVSEYEIIKNIKALYVFHNITGNTIFEYKFTNQKIDPDLLTSFLTAIDGGLSEATGDLSKVKEIIKENIYILIEHDKFFSTIIISEKNYAEIRNKIIKFNKEFSEQYNKFLENWNGDITPFKKAKNIIYEIFKINPKDEKKYSISSETTELSSKYKKINGYKTSKHEKSMNYDILGSYDNQIYYFYCEECNQWYKVETPGNYKCIYCNNELVDKTDLVRKELDKE